MSATVAVISLILGLAVGFSALVSRISVLEVKTDSLITKTDKIQTLLEKFTTKTVAEK